MRRLVLLVSAIVLVETTFFSALAPLLPHYEDEFGLTKQGAGVLTAIYVQPDRWGHGAGSALMRAALARLAELPYDEVILWTFKENGPALGFYERHGWSLDGEQKVHPRTEAAAVRLRRPTPKTGGAMPAEGTIERR